MRSIDPDPDPFLPLGHPIEQRAKPAPAPAPLPGSPGIKRAPDGKLSTNLPLPSLAAAPAPESEPRYIWPFLL